MCTFSMRTHSCFCSSKQINFIFRTKRKKKEVLNTIPDWSLQLFRELLDAAQFDRADLERIREASGGTTAALMDLPMASLTAAPFFLRKEQAACFVRCRDRLFQRLKNGHQSRGSAVVPRRLRKDGRFFYSVPKKAKEGLSGAARKGWIPPPRSSSPPTSRQISESLSVFDFTSLNTHQHCVPNKKTHHHHSSAARATVIQRQDSAEMNAVTLPLMSDLNTPPEDWRLHLAPDNVAGLVLSTDDAVDVVCYAEQMRKLLLLPMVSDVPLLIRVYRVGQTLILEDVPEGVGLPTVRDTHNSALYSKFLFRSGSTSPPRGDCADGEPSQQVSRTLLWSCKEVKVLIGVKEQVFVDPTNHQEMFLKLREEGELTERELLNYWVENILSNVHLQRIGLHEQGFLRRYEQLSTQELALRLGSVDIGLVEEQAGRMLRWLQDSCTQDLSVYNILFDPSRPTEFNLYHEYTHNDRLTIGSTQQSQRSNVFSAHVVGSIYFRDAERAFPLALTEASADHIISTLNTYMNAIYYFGKATDRNPSLTHNETTAHLNCAQLLLRLSGVHALNMKEESARNSAAAAALSIAIGLEPTAGMQETLRNAVQHLGQALHVAGPRPEVLHIIHAAVGMLCGDFATMVPRCVVDSALRILREAESALRERNEYDSELPLFTSSFCSLYILGLTQDMTDNAEQYHGECLHCIFRRRKEKLSPGEDVTLAQYLIRLHIAMSRRHMRQHRFSKAMSCLQSALRDVSIAHDPNGHHQHVLQEIEATYVAEAARAVQFSPQQKELYRAACSVSPDPSPGTLLCYVRALTHDYTQGAASGVVHLQRVLDILRKDPNATDRDWGEAEFRMGVLCAKLLEEERGARDVSVQSASITFTSGLTNLRRALERAAKECCSQPRQEGPVGRIIRIHAATARLYLARATPQVPQAMSELRKVLPYYTSTTGTSPSEADAADFLREVREILKRALHAAIVSKQMTTVVSQLKTLYATAVQSIKTEEFLNTLKDG